jgi:hypothetical protein
MSKIQEIRIEEESLNANACMATVPVVQLVAAHTLALYTALTVVHSAAVHLLNTAPVSAPQPSLGSSAPSLGDLPLPPVDPSGCPDPSNFDPNHETTIDGNGYLDRLRDFIAYIKQNPSDPNALQKFMQFIANCSNTKDASGKCIIDDMQPTLDDAGTQDLLMLAVTENMEIAFFMGDNNGENGARTFLTNFITALGQIPPNKYIQKMIDAASGQLVMLSQFTKDHTDAQGNLIWDASSFGTPNRVYTWPADKDMIKQIMFTQYNGSGSVPWFPDLDLDQFEKDYRMRALIQLLEEFKNPEIAIMLWVMTVFDKQSQGQEGGLASTTNLLTNMTNQYATPLLQLLKNLESQTPDKDQAADFVKRLADITNLLNMEQQTGSISKSWNDNTYTAIRSVTIPSGTYQGKTLGDVMDDCLGGKMKSDDVAAVFATFYPQSQGGGGTTSPQFEAMSSAIQSGGALITGTSKTVSAQVQTVANTDNEIVKLGHSVADPSGGGLMQLMQKILDATNKVS